MKMSLTDSFDPLTDSVVPAIAPRSAKRKPAAIDENVSSQFASLILLTLNFLAGYLGVLAGTEWMNAIPLVSFVAGAGLLAWRGFPRVRAVVLVKADWFVYGASFVFVLLCSFNGSWSSLIALTSKGESMMLARHAVVGIAFGAILRSRFRKFVHDSKHDSAHPSAILAFPIILFGTLFLIPEPEPSGFVLAYFLGFGIGMSAHKLAVTITANAASAFRRRRLLPHPVPATATPDEHRALTAFKLKKDRTLRKLFKEIDVRDSGSTTLALVRSGWYRVNGEHAKAIVTAEDALGQIEERLGANLDHLVQALPLVPEESESVDVRLYPYLLLVAALSHGELFNDRKMWKTLRRIEGLRPDCSLLNCTVGQRLYDRFSRDLLFDTTNQEIHKRAEKAHFASERFRASARDAPTTTIKRLGKLLQSCAPVNDSILMDTYGCGLLALGYREQARQSFSDIINRDSRYGAAYMHLGDCYIAEYRFGRGVNNELLDHAMTWYEIAVRLERSKSKSDSRTKKMVLRRISTVKRLR